MSTSCLQTVTVVRADTYLTDFILFVNRHISCMNVRKNYGILYYLFDKCVQNPLQNFVFTVRLVCKLLLAIKAYDFDLDSGSTRGGEGSYFCMFVTSK
jgi:hypothetical protein